MSFGFCACRDHILMFGLYEGFLLYYMIWFLFALCAHLALVPGLGLLSAAGCNVLVLSFNLSDDLLHVEAAAVVHLHHHRRVFDAGLQLAQLLVRVENRPALVRSSS